MSLFMTGEGQTTPAGLTGTITTTSPLPPITPAAIFPVTVNVDGLLAPVLFYGEAPGLVSGVMQLNLQVPSGARSGSVPIVAFVGGNPTQSNVTISVK